MMNEKVMNWYEKVDDIYSKKEFKEKIEKRKTKSNNLFTEEVTARIIVAEEGRDNSGKKKIEDLEVDKSATVKGEITNLGQTYTFEKSNGEGRVRNVTINDGTGSVKVVFWDEDVEMVEEEFSTGDTLNIINGYVQDKGYGKQISEGKWGKIEHEK